MLVQTRDEIARPGFVVARLAQRPTPCGQIVPARAT